MIAASEQKTAEAQEQSIKAQQAMAEAEKAGRQAEFAKREGMLQMAQRLGSIVAQAYTASDSLTTNNNDASAGAATQRRRALETAAAMEEMNAAVCEVGRTAFAAMESADKARDNALNGKRIVGSVITAIRKVDRQTTDLSVCLNQLGERARSIVQIMNGITDIADQTKLLVLGALEATQAADEAGRGFAVVVDIVSKLAARTMAAAKDVSNAGEAIQAGALASIRGMEETSALMTRSAGSAREAGDALGTILSITETTTDTVLSIARSSEELSSAGKEISRNTGEIRRVAEETAALMDEATAVANELRGLIRQIHQAVEEFRQA
jgi:methyl-accepting chemotaxis protein